MATMIGLFDTVDQAQQLISDVVGAGISREAISVITPSNPADIANHETPGGALGLLSDFGTHTIPGIGAVLTAGSLASMFGSTADRGVLDVLADLGVASEQAHSFAEGMRRGSTLVAVQADNLPVVMVQNFLASNGVVDVDSRGASWRENGWERFDPDAQPYVPEESGERRAEAPLNESELTAEENIGTSTGALSGGTLPGGYGAVSDALFGLDENERRGK